MLPFGDIKQSLTVCRESFGIFFVRGTLGSWHVSSASPTLSVCFVEVRGEKSQELGSREVVGLGKPFVVLLPLQSCSVRVIC